MYSITQNFKLVAENILKIVAQEVICEENNISSISIKSSVDKIAHIIGIIACEY